MQIEQGVYALGRVGIVEERIYVLCRVDIIEEGVYALCRVGGRYKILGRSESQAVKKPSNRGVATLVREHTAHPPTALALRQTS